MNENTSSDREALKALRESRRETIEKVRQALKIQNRDLKKIRDALQSGPKTIPEIAGLAGMSSAQTLQYVAGLKKYGQVIEGAKQDDYFAYELVK